MNTLVVLDPVVARGSTDVFGTGAVEPPDGRTVTESSRRGPGGTTPLVICERYASGGLSRDELIEELVSYPYVEEGRTDGYDWLAVDPPGTWSEISEATSRGLIDGDVYAEVFWRLHPDAPDAATDSSGPR